MESIEAFFTLAVADLDVWQLMLIVFFTTVVAN